MSNERPSSPWPSSPLVVGVLSVNNPSTGEGGVLRMDREFFGEEVPFKLKPKCLQGRVFKKFDMQLMREKNFGCFVLGLFGVM